MPRTRRCVAALAVAVLVPLAACSDQDAEPSKPASLGSEIVYSSGSTIHFATTGEQVDVDRDISFSYYSTAGILAEVESNDPNRLSDLVLVRKDGSVTDVDVPPEAAFATDAASPYLAWTDPENDPGTVVVLDLLTGDEQAHITVPGKRIHHDQVALEGDLVWLHDDESDGAFRIDWRSGEVEKIDPGYLSEVHGNVGITMGGTEGIREAGLGRPGVIDLRNGKLIAPGNLWEMSPTGTTVGHEQVRYADGGVPVSGHLVVRGVPKGAATRFRLTYDDGSDTSWGWSADGTRVLWFEGSTLHACVITTRDCTTTITDVDPDETFGAIPVTAL